MLRPVASSDSLPVPSCCSYRRKPRRCAGPLPAQDVKPDEKKIKPRSDEASYICIKPTPSSVDTKPKYEDMKPYPWVKSSAACSLAQDIYYPAQDLHVWGKDELLKAEESK